MAHDDAGDGGADDDVDDADDDDDDDDDDVSLWTSQPIDLHTCVVLDMFSQRCKGSDDPRTGKAMNVIISTARIGRR